MQLLFRQLIDLWGEPISQAQLDPCQSIGSICTDSRKVKEGDFFVPLIGETFDGHSFLYQAFELGAKAAIVSRECKFKIPKGLVYWVVENTLYAYQQLALVYRCQLDIPIIAVTGSAGKTTTRELICSILKPLGDILSSSQNYNNDVGVPLTLLGADPSHRAVVVEMGMRGPGEIERLSRCAKPDIAVITNIGSAHIGLLGSQENIAKAKCEITTFLSPSGLVVIPAGFPLLEKNLAKSWSGRVVRVALSANTSFKREWLNLSEDVLSKKTDLVGRFNPELEELELEGKTYPLPLEGRHNALNLLLALAVARELDVPWKLTKEMSIDLPKGRARRLKIGSLTVLDETYNASPEAMLAALELLVSYPGRHFAVLGTMLELGKHSLYFHRKVIQKASELGLDGLVVVASGQEAHEMQAASKGIPRFALVDTPEMAAEPLRVWLKAKDTLLLKASRLIALERLLPLLKGF